MPWRPILGSGFLLSLVAPSAGAYVFLGGAVLSFLVFFLYGAAGLIVIPFQDSFWSGFLCWTCPPYLLGYTWRRWDVMRGPFLSYLASFGVIILMAIALPGMAALNRSPVRLERAAFAVGRPPTEDGGVPAERLARGFPAAAVPPVVIRPPIMSNSITLEVKGLNDQASGKAVR